MKHWLAAVVVFSSCVAHKSTYRLNWLAYDAYEKNDWDTCSRLFLEVTSKLPTRSEALVGAASCEARAGKLDAALHHVKAAVARGYRHDLSTDEDLAPLHQFPEWPQLVERAHANRRVHNAELFALRAADQQDRREPIDWAVVTPRDEERQKRVEAIVAAGGAKTSVDFENAALVMHHSETIEGIARANEFAKQAMQLDDGNIMAKKLVGMTTDRLLVMQKKPQRFGTQFHAVDGALVREPVDPSVTDEERASYFLEPLTR